MKFTALSAALLGATILPGLALAETPSAEDEARSMPPFATNQVGGQLVMAARGALVVPLGGISESLKHQDVAKSGFGAGLDLGYGLGRDTVLGLYGDLNFFGSAGSCSDCSPLSYAVGAFARYHIVQGLRFDPWLSYGMGFRALTYELSTGTANYAGFEWMRLGIGGDWQVSPALGLGPFAEFSGASFFDRPDGEGSGKANWRFQTGIRVVLSIPGKTP